MLLKWRRFLFIFNNEFNCFFIFCFVDILVWCWLFMLDCKDGMICCVEFSIFFLKLVDVGYFGRVLSKIFKLIVDLSICFVNGLCVIKVLVRLCLFFGYCWWLVLCVFNMFFSFFNDILFMLNFVFFFLYK